MTTAPIPRCHRCDQPVPGPSLPRHKCGHGKPCVEPDAAGACAECRSFKERQQAMFGDHQPTPARPFLKWAGGKRQLVPQLLKHVPEYRGRYFEPLVGGGAMFFALQPDRAVLADINQRLIRTYGAVRYDVEGVITKLADYPYDKDFFLALRSKDVDGYRDDVDVACWLLYLNKTAFNGLYRVNKSNRFNVPWGKYRNPTICDAQGLRAAALALRCARFVCGDFEYAVRDAEEDDLVYFDPPYVPRSQTSNFVQYGSDGFGLNDQVRLRDCALALKSRGVHVMITNSNTPTVRELYAGFTIRRLRARTCVSASGKARSERVDLLMT